MSTLRHAQKYIDIPHTKQTRQVCSDDVCGHQNSNLQSVPELYQPSTQRSVLSSVPLLFLRSVKVY